MNIEGALTEYLKRQGVEDIDQVVNFWDDTESDGYCSTCYYTYAVVKIEYKTTAGGRKTYTYDDSFAGLIREL